MKRASMSVMPAEYVKKEIPKVEMKRLVVEEKLSKKTEALTVKTIRTRIDLKYSEFAFVINNISRRLSSEAMRLMLSVHGLRATWLQAELTYVHLLLFWLAAQGIR